LKPLSPPRSPLFPYTTLFRSWLLADGDHLGIPIDVAPLCDSRLTDAETASHEEIEQRILGFVGDGKHRRKLFLGVDGILLVFGIDRKSTRLNSSHRTISYAVF